MKENVGLCQVKHLIDHLIDFEGEGTLLKLANRYVFQVKFVTCSCQIIHRLNKCYRLNLMIDVMFLYTVFICVNDFVHLFQSIIKHNQIIQHKGVLSAKQFS